MESNTREISDTNAEFRKPSNDAANRKYRRRSPAGGSSPSSDGSPHHKRSLGPVPSRKDMAKIADDRRKRDDDRDQSGHSDDLYKHSDRQSSRSYYRHDDGSRRDRRVDDNDRGYSKSSYRSTRDSRGNNASDYSRSDKDYRSRDYVNDADTYSRAKSDVSGRRSRDKDTYDRARSGRRHANNEERDRHREDRSDRYGKTDDRKTSRDHRINCSPGYEESRSQRNDYPARRDNVGYHSKELDCERHAYDEKRRDDDRPMYKEQGSGETKVQSDDMSIKSEEPIAKKPKILDSSGPGADVNKNLVGTGYMSTDQKKKLLWGNKKNTSTEESANRWDTTTFGDRERQEKFNKLMGVKGDSKVEHKPDGPDVEKQREELQVELERQYTAGLRRRDGRTVGLGL